MRELSYHEAIRLEIGDKIFFPKLNESGFMELEILNHEIDKEGIHYFDCSEGYWFATATENPETSRTHMYVEN